MLERLCVHRLGPQYVALLDEQVDLMENYISFLDDENFSSMYLKEVIESINKMHLS